MPWAPREPAQTPGVAELGTSAKVVCDALHRQCSIYSLT